MAYIFVHEARIALAEGADEYALGAAVTAELCGHWEHEGTCRWQHHTGVYAKWGRAVTVRTAFVSEPEEEQEVRARIVKALRTGHLEAPKGTSSWQVLNEGPVRDRRAAPDRFAGWSPPPD